MPKELKGSCHCGAVKYTVQAFAPVPYQICLCGICTKVCGQGGAIYLGALADSLKLEGEENINGYRASCSDGTSEQKVYKSERKFCKHCGTMLLLDVFAYPGAVFPFASSVDTELLDPAKLEHPQPLTIMHADDRKPWAHLPEGEKKLFSGFPDEDFEQWHRKAGVWGSA